MDQKNIIQLKELIGLFEHNLKQYKGKHYDEAKARADFIDKFFELLGWDVYNKKGYSEQYRDVVREDRVEVKGKVKAPDYCFRIGGARKFFVEAKKPAVDIKQDIEPAFQLRRYAYTARLPLSILTDFEEFAIYDTRIKPDKRDQASAARIFYCAYQEYEKEFDFIFNTFSREAILKGSFDQYIEETKRKKGTSEVDKEFLKLIEQWRETLAKNIALRNKDLSIYELNYAVQKIIDRIIFLRIAEDRHIEDYGRIQKLNESKTTIYPDLVKLFLQADVKYDSGLFDFKADRITPHLKIDDKILKDIIRSLYYPDSPYEFSVFDVEILGNIYEQFLGKTIRLTASHQAKVEDKPEVKKAGGVYYTPKYIVDYIVKNTVGEKIKDQTPEQITRLKICDPACGSGSFLLGAYQTLLDYHLDYYTQEKNIKKARKENKIYQLKENEYRLSIEEKHRILLNNIFGVDIDSQAVEVTKLSLLLKLMEGESQESFGLLFKFSEIKLLPDLSDNIKCGNSLIGSDFYEKGQMDLFQDEETTRRINVFDWDKEFPDIFAQGGFDVVIGNPPYIRIQGLQEFQPESVPYIKRKYISSSEGSIDIYIIFLERALELLNQNGLSGYILPHKFFQATMGKNIRKLISQKKAIKQIINFGANQVFENATTYTCLFFMSKKPMKNFLYKKIELGKKIQNELENQLEIKKIDINESLNSEWNFYSGNKAKLLARLINIPLKLGNITNKIFQGIATSADKIYVLEKLSSEEKNEKIVEVFSRSLNRRIHIEKDIIKPFLMGKDVNRYEEPVYKNYVIFPYSLSDGNANLMSQAFIREKYPLGWDYLIKNKKDLEGRERGRMKGSDFYAYIYPKNLTNFEKVKIITPEISNYPKFTIDKHGDLFHTTTVYSFLFNEKALPSEKFYLGILNSKLLWFFLKSTGYVLMGGYFRFKTNYLSPFPVPILDINKTKDKNNYVQLERNVKQLLTLKEKLNITKTENEKKMFKKQIDILDHQIDQLVYKLYGLTEEEIKIVEGKND